jgi:ActR/RegA family two-component response regulator
MTTQDMVGWIADAYNVSNDYAKMMLGDFKNYSADLAKELNTNDFTAAIENAYEKLRTIKVGDVAAHSVVDKKIIDISEIEALAELYGKEVGEVYTMFEGKAFITNFYDENGFLQETSVILG